MRQDGFHVARIAFTVFGLLINNELLSKFCRNHTDVRGKIIRPGGKTRSKLAFLWENHTWDNQVYSSTSVSNPPPPLKKQKQKLIYI